MNDIQQLNRLADIGATVLIEAHACRVASTYPQAVWDTSTPDLAEMPDGETPESMAQDLRAAAQHLFERGLLVRPVDGQPQFVSFGGGHG